MVAKGSKKGLIVTIIILGLTVLVVGGFVVWQNLNKTPVNSDSSQTNDNNKPDDTPANDTPADVVPEEPVTPAVDPATLAFINIEPMKVAVYYTKGIGGFDFNVKRSADRTEYVEFSSATLVGTKCTGDEGSIASIIKDPPASAKETITATKALGDVSYGLSLAGKNCTKDTALLEKYQTAFTNGFSQLKVME